MTYAPRRRTECFGRGDVPRSPLVGFGYIFERFDLFLTSLTGQSMTTTQQAVLLWLGVTLLMIGAGVAVVSALKFRSVVRRFGKEENVPAGWTNLGVWLNLLVAAISAALAGYVIWTP